MWVPGSGLPYREMFILYGYTDTQTQTGRQTDTDTDRQTDRQTDRDIMFIPNQHC